MALVPSTPQRTTGAVKTATPRTALKPRTALSKTIHSFDANSSYVEADDATYIHETTDDDLEDDGEEFSVVDDLMVATPVESTPETKSETKPETEPILPPPTLNFQKFIVKHEIGRKLLHLFIGVFTLKMYTMGISQRQFILPLFILFTVIFINDFVRFRNPKLNQRIVRATWWMIRENEINEYNGTLWYLVGLIIVFIIMPKDVLMMSVLLLLWADTAALSVGRAWGKYTPKISTNKLVAGCLGSFAAGVFACVLFYGYFVPHYPQVNQPGDVLWDPAHSKMTLATFAVATGVIALVLEMIDFMGLDDNFTIPVISAFALYVLIRATEV